MSIRAPSIKWSGDGLAGLLDGGAASSQVVELGVGHAGGFKLRGCQYWARLNTTNARCVANTPFERLAKRQETSSTQAHGR